jgi:hypothetical protein
MFFSEWREFPSGLALHEKKELDDSWRSMLLKSCAFPEMLPFSICIKKILVIGT